MPKHTPAPAQHPAHAVPPNHSADLIEVRRDKLRQDGAGIAAKLPANGADVWGLALSGGGIRSATFSLGLLRGLAQNKLLNRFDVLSTVSGGSYIGSMLGRLYARTRPHTAQPGADQVEEALAHADSRWFGWWLRCNGRYLAPAGFVDRLLAITLYLRNLLALHFEFGLLAVLLGGVLAAFDLAVWGGLDLLGYGAWAPALFDWLNLLQPWLPTAWLALLPLAPVALHLVFAYWDSQWVQRRAGCYFAVKIVGAIVLLGAACQLGRTIQHFAASPATEGLDTLLLGLAIVVVVVSFTSLLHSLLAWRSLSRSNAQLLNLGKPGKDAMAELRNRLTQLLMNCLRASLLILALGIVERLAWLLAFQSRSFETLDLGIALAVASGIAQALMLSLRGAKGQQQDGKPASRLLPLALQLLGYLLTAALFVWWVSLLLKIVFTAVFPDLVKSDGTPLSVIAPQFAGGWLALLYLWVPPALYVAATGANLGFLNLSSLHTFYKARLVRSYLGATNPSRFGDQQPVSALDPIKPHNLTTSQIRNVGQVMPADDVALADYAPHEAGGPVHIINTCVNQTADPDGRLFNRDRQGLLLSVRAGGGSRLSQEGWRNEFKGIGQLSLGAWMAISGAAAAPGMGPRTQRGLAALLTFAGVRLGYWLSQRERGGAAVAGTIFSRMQAKSKALLSELSATFDAGPDANWFLTDGGHFENTGVYPLLLERARVIVLADCGADPSYSFEDVENLVRKARIDMGIRITFRRPNDLAGLPAEILGKDACDWSECRKYFGTLQELTRDDSEACLALATLEYPDDTCTRQAIMILVKPNICRSVPMDVANYKRQNPVFPQETTGDQFFSENQWESYFALGNNLGEHLCADLLSLLREHLPALFDLQPEHAEGHSAMPDKPAAEAASRSIWGRHVSTVGATVGAGVVLSLAVAGWQAYEAYRSSLNNRIAGERQAMVAIARLWGKLPAGEVTDSTGTTARKLAAELLRSGDAYCKNGEAGWLIRSELGKQVIKDAVQACSALNQGMGQACQTLVQARAGLDSLDAGACLMPAPRVSTAVYWGYDYSAQADWERLHPCSTRRNTLARLQTELQETYKVQASDERPAQDLAVVQEGCPLKPKPVAQIVAGQPSPEVGAMTGSAAAEPQAPEPMALPAPAPTPVPQPVPAPAAEAEPEPTISLPINSSDICKDTTIYMQIHGPEMRDKARTYRSWWHDKWQANVPPIEDVVASAFRAARPAPAPVSETTVRVHDSLGYACAAAIVAVVKQQTAQPWRLERLSSAYKGSRGVIEVWFSNPAQQRAQPDQQQQ
ncbi:patatin-like phospholipase family protein [Pseudomonas muyukensis]|uniref:Patatin-like phospholipase family protein n=1 Tax=Pseudomonas muyukensis TaxID=2842357 RepID=A0ABX8M3M4_9PSED|nr:patatin-like phospholipase family protein [Pseudomonas muyukensis]QXH33709.1 patatin-like phospholipase family protein [Pseudomonas muyukensis]